MPIFQQFPLFFSAGNPAKRWAGELAFIYQPVLNIYKHLFGWYLAMNIYEHQSIIYGIQ